MKILIVEDNLVNMNLLKVIVQKHGHMSIEAENGEKGIMIAAKEIPDIILMDIMLPYIDGLEAVRRIRMLENMKSVPIIAITSFAMAGDREKILEAGCNGYFEKPINPLTIINEIEMIIKAGKK